MSLETAVKRIRKMGYTFRATPIGEPERPIGFLVEATRGSRIYCLAAKTLREGAERILQVV